MFHNFSLIRLKLRFSPFLSWSWLLETDSEFKSAAPAVGAKPDAAERRWAITYPISRSSKEFLLISVLRPADAHLGFSGPLQHDPRDLGPMGRLAAGLLVSDWLSYVFGLAHRLSHYSCCLQVGHVRDFRNCLLHVDIKVTFMILMFYGNKTKFSFCSNVVNFTFKANTVSPTRALTRFFTKERHLEASLCIVHDVCNMKNEGTYFIFYLFEKFPLMFNEHCYKYKVRLVFVVVILNDFEKESTKTLILVFFR